MDVYCNGEARPTNPGPAYAGFVAYTPLKTVREKQEVFLGKTSTEKAAYRSIIMALSWLEKEDTLFRLPGEVCIYTDSLPALISIRDFSAPVIQPFEAFIKRIRESVQKLESSGTLIEFNHVPKESQKCNPFPESTKLKKVTCFKTPDGEYFESEEEAEEHSKKYVFVKEIEALFLKEEPGVEITETLWKARKTLSRLL